MIWEKKKVLNSVMQQLLKKAKQGNVFILRDDLALNNSVIISEPRYNACYKVIFQGDEVNKIIIF